MQLSQIRTNLSYLGYDSTLASQMNYFINACYREIYGSQRWPWAMATTTATVAPGSTTLPIPAAAYQVDAVRFVDAQNNPYNTENLDPQSMRDQVYDDNTSTGAPEYWTLYPSGVITIWPTTDIAYTAQIDYLARPADLVNDTDVPLIPIEFHDVLVFGAARLIAQRERDVYSEQTWGSEYQRLKSLMDEAYNLRQTQTSSSICQSGFYSPKRRGW